jgi:ribosomal protein S18 acetylase RimI-like enzyme
VHAETERENMRKDILERVKIVELVKDDVSISELKYTYVTTSYYDVSVLRQEECWKVGLTLKPLGKPLEKGFVDRLFAKHVEDSRVFAAVLDGQQIGWVELGYQRWNNRMRLWELLVKEEFRRAGIGSLLMQCAVKVAEEKRARMLVLETQSCNVPAIDFYLKHGFGLIGFDTTAYSNEDVEKKEVRLEFGLAL